jgi:cytochrome o ubiquinol oxidase operon protein cyoD
MDFHFHYRLFDGSIVMSRRQTTVHPPGNGRGTAASYTVGFILSIALTLGAYFVVTSQNDAGNPAMSYGYIIGAIVVLAIVQLLVQLRYFIHLGQESGPRWNRLMFMFMLLIVFIVVGGTLWIMNNLDYHHADNKPKDGSDTPTKMDDYPHYDPAMTPSETDQFIIHDEGINR